MGQELEGWVISGRVGDKKSAVRCAKKGIKDKSQWVDESRRKMGVGERRMEN